MSVRTGDKLTFDDVGVQVIVTTGGDAEVTVAPATDDALQVGKRYRCDESGIQVLVVKPGNVTLQCDGRPMALQEAKKTKAAD